MIRKRLMAPIKQAPVYKHKRVDLIQTPKTATKEALVTKSALTIAKEALATTKQRVAAVTAKLTESIKTLTQQVSLRQDVAPALELYVSARVTRRQCAVKQVQQLGETLAETRRERPNQIARFRGELATASTGGGGGGGDNNELLRYSEFRVKIENPFEKQRINACNEHKHRLALLQRAEDYTRTHTENIAAAERDMKNCRNEYSQCIRAISEALDNTSDDDDDSDDNNDFGDEDDAAELQELVSEYQKMATNLRKELVRGFKHLLGAREALLADTQALWTHFIE